jgi:hypothetical protein
MAFKYPHQRAAKATNATKRSATADLATSGPGAVAATKKSAKLPAKARSKRY